MGLKTASVFLGLSIAGLVTLSYFLHKTNVDEDLFRKEFVNNPKTEIAMAYSGASDKLEAAAGYMGKYVIKDDKVIVIDRLNKEETRKYLDEVITEISKSEESKQYINKILEIDSGVLLLDKSLTNTKACQELKNKTKQLVYEFDNLALRYDPNLDGIEYQLNIKYPDTEGWYVLGIVLNSIAVIGTGFWTGCEAYDFVDERKSSYHSRKRVKNKI